MSAAAEEAAKPHAFPWREAMHAGLFLLRLPAHDFWGLTPIEFHAISGGLSPRFDLPLKDLMARYPDEKEPIS